MLTGLCEESMKHGNHFKPKLRRKDNIKVDIKEVEWKVVDLTSLEQDG
jgi:hypothetical protein